MSVIAITGVSGQIARALLPLLENDAEVDRIIGIDLIPPTLEMNKLTLPTAFSLEGARDYRTNTMASWEDSYSADLDVYFRQRPYVCEHSED